MSWIEKLQVVSKLGDKWSEFLAIYTAIPKSPADIQAIRSLFDSFPFLPKEYKHFLEIYNGIYLNRLTLFGDDQSTLPFASSSAYLSDSSVHKHFCSIGTDYGGGEFVIGVDGHVCWVTETDYETRPEVIATSFDCFLDEVILGPSYHLICPSGIPSNDEWQMFLKSMKWA